MIARHHRRHILAVACLTVVAFTVIFALSSPPSRVSFPCRVWHEYECHIKTTLSSPVFALESGLGLMSHFPISGNIATATAPGVPHTIFYKRYMQLSYLVTGSAPYGREAWLARSVPPQKHPILAR